MAKEPERHFALDRVPGPCLAEQRNPVLEVLLTLRGHELEERPAVLAPRDEEQPVPPPLGLPGLLVLAKKGQQGLLAHRVQALRHGRVPAAARCDRSDEFPIGRNAIPMNPAPSATPMRREPRPVTSTMDVPCGRSPSGIAVIGSAPAPSAPARQTPAASSPAAAGPRAPRVRSSATLREPSRVSTTPRRDHPPVCVRPVRFPSSRVVRNLLLNHARPAPRSPARRDSGATRRARAGDATRRARVGPGSGTN